MSKEAPLYVRSYDLTLWLHRHCAKLDRELDARLRLLRCAEELTLQIMLALRDMERRKALQLADQELMRMRLLARLASELRIFSPAQLEHVTRQLDDIGRQLGGWRARLHRV